MTDIFKYEDPDMEWILIENRYGRRTCRNVNNNKCRVSYVYIHSCGEGLQINTLRVLIYPHWITGASTLCSRAGIKLDPTIIETMQPFKQIHDIAIVRQ